MAKRFSSKRTRKTKVRLNPKDATKVIEAEFTDSKGNKIYFDMNIIPHLPNKPTLEWERKYNGE